MKKPGGEFCCFIIDRFINKGIFVPLNLILKIDLFCTLFMGLSRLEVYNLEPFQQVQRSFKFKVKYSTNENGYA